VGLSRLLLIQLPLLGPLQTALTLPAGPWDDATQKAEDCHLQAVLLAAAQAGKKNSKKRDLRVFERKVPSQAGLLQEMSGCCAAGGGQAAQPWAPRLQEPGEAGGACGSPGQPGAGGWGRSRADRSQPGGEGSPLPPASPSTLVTELFANSWPRWRQAAVLCRCSCRAGPLLVSPLVRGLILGQGIRPGVDGPPGAEGPGSGRAWHVLPADAGRVGAQRSGKGCGGGACPVLAAAVIIGSMDLRCCNQ